LIGRSAVAAWSQHPGTGPAATTDDGSFTLGLESEHFSHHLAYLHDCVFSVVLLKALSTFGSIYYFAGVGRVTFG